MLLKIVSLFTFLLFFNLTSSGAEESRQEWIVYFSTEDAATQYQETHPEQVLDQSGRTLKVTLSSIEKDALSSGVSVEAIEPNYRKAATNQSAGNDPLFPQQWGLKAIQYTSFPSTPSKNELLGREFTINNEVFVYDNAPFSADSFQVDLSATTLSRVSVELEEIEGLWTLGVFDGKGTLLASNVGALKKLDVLLPKKAYDEVRIVINTANEWTQPPQVVNVEGVNHSIVAVIDSGIHLHEDFCGNVLYSLGKNYKENLPHPEDKNGHGTHVTGILAACSNNGIGITGVIGNAPIDVLPLKVLDANGYGGDFEISKAIYEAIDKKVDLINLSITGRGQTIALKEAVLKALNSNIPIVAAAGNWDISTDQVFPAAYPGVITVAGVTEELKKVSTSNYGWEVDISAPGMNILSTYLDHQYHFLNGTSMATPYVTGTLALVKALYPGIDLISLRNHLFNTSEDVLAPGYDLDSGYGVVNMKKMLSQQLSSEGIEWLSLKEGQDFASSDEHFIGVASKWVGKRLTVFANDVLIDEGTIENSIEKIDLSGVPEDSGSIKLLAIITDDEKKVYGVDRLTVGGDKYRIESSLFSDVAASFWAYKEIGEASQLGIINGYGDGSFKPNAAISRKHSVLMLNRLFQWEELDSYLSPFQDVNSELTTANLAIMIANQKGIIQGYREGRGQYFRPEKPLTRGQMALVLARALDLDNVPYTGTKHEFHDIAPSAEYYDEVQHLTSLGIITKQKTYRPNQQITRAQFAAMLSRIK